MHFNLKRSFGNKFRANGVFISRIMHVNCSIMRIGEVLPGMHTAHFDCANKKALQFL